MATRTGHSKDENDAWIDEKPGPSRTRWTIAGILLGFGVAGWAGMPRDRAGTGNHLGHAVNSIAAGVQDASDTVRDKFAEAQRSARNLGVEQQISARLHGDKSFDANKIEVHVEEECTAVLRGLVPDATAKEKAVTLAQDTKGVLKVVDHLAVIPKARIIINSPPKVDADLKAVDNVPAVATRAGSQRSTRN